MSGPEWIARQGHEVLYLASLRDKKKITYAKGGGTMRFGDDAAGRVEEHYRRALCAEIDRLEKDVNELHDLLGKAEASRDCALADAARLRAELEGTWAEVEEANEKVASLTEADTVTYQLSEEDRLTLAHLEHRHNLLAEEVRRKIAEESRLAIRAQHRSRCLLGFVWAFTAALMLWVLTSHAQISQSITALERAW